MELRFLWSNPSQPPLSLRGGEYFPLKLRGMRGLGGVTLQGGGFRLLIVVEKICTRDAKSKCLYREFLGGAETKKT